MPDDFYEQMDRAGILVDGGFQCCDAWQLQDSQLTTRTTCGARTTPPSRSARTCAITRACIDFSWSDNNPTPKQETVSLRGFR